MKKITYLLYLCIFCALTNSRTNFTAPSQTINGFAAISDKTFDTLTVNGAGELASVTVTSDSHVNGALAAEHCTFNSLIVQGSTILAHTTAHNLTVSGQATLDYTTITGSTKIQGEANICHSRLNSVEAASTHISFANSKMLSITMKAPTENTGFWSFFSWFRVKTKQIIELHDTTVQSGIVFKQEGGVVILKGNCHIDGKIIGGSVKKAKL